MGRHQDVETPTPAPIVPSKRVVLWTPRPESSPHGGLYNDYGDGQVFVAALRRILRASMAAPSAEQHSAIAMEMARRGTLRIKTTRDA